MDKVMVTKDSREDNITAAHVKEQAPGKSSSGHGEIGVAVALVSVPFSVLSVALLSVVLSYRIQGSFQVDESVSGQNYLVNLSATTITLIASYSSTIAPIAIGFAMTMIFYSISGAMIKQSEKGRFAELPTPYQMGLLVAMRGGGMGPLWDWFKYVFLWRVKHKVGGALKIGTTSLFVATLLSYYLALLLQFDL